MIIDSTLDQMYPWIIRNPLKMFDSKDSCLETKITSGLLKHVKGEFCVDQTIDNVKT